MNPYYKRAKEFSEVHIAPYAEDIDAHKKFPREIFDKIKEEGFFKLIIPKEDGGEGAGPDAQAYVSQAFAEGCATVGLCYTMHNVALKFVLTFGRDELKEQITKEVVEENKMLSLARSEFGTGVHVFKSETDTKNTDEYSIINGAKSMITSANYADYYLISVPKDEKGRAVNWLVPYGTEGLSFDEDAWQGIGMRGNNSCPMYMEDMKLDNKYAVYIDKNKTPSQYPVNIDVIYFMTGLAGIYSGMTLSLLEAAIDHTQNRKYPNGNLAEIESVQVQLSELYNNMVAAKGGLSIAVEALMKEKDDALDKMMSARVIASENAVDSARIAMKLGGGAAYNRKGSIERLMRDAFASQVMFPSIDVLKTWIGKDITGQSFA